MLTSNLCAIGKLDIDLNLTLRKYEVEYFKFDISEYNKVEDLKNLFYPEEKEKKTNDNNEEKNEEENEKPNINYFDYISLSSQDNFTNMLLFINRAFKEKIFVELILLNKIEFSEEKKFVKLLIEKICAKNYFFIIENKIYDIPVKINFRIQILKDESDEIIESKIFQMFENNEIPEEKEREKEKNLFYKLHYNFNKSNYFLSNFDDLINIEEESPYDIALFYKLLILNYNKIKIITNISKDCVNESSDSELINSLKKIIDLSDYIISDRNTLNNFYEIYFRIYKKETEIKKIKKNLKPNSDYIILDNEKKRKNIERTTILINDLENIRIYKQEGIKMRSIYEEEFNCNEIYKGNKKQNKEIINENYNFYSNIFIGAFLSRFLHNKTFLTCINAGCLSVKNMIEISKNKINYITDLDIYNVVVPVKKKKKDNIDKEKLLLEFKKIKRKEKGFNLDCTNLGKFKSKEYNALLDENCQSYFTNPFTQNYLRKQGFINKKGIILKDPDKIINIPHISMKRFLKTSNLNFRFKPSPLKKSKQNIYSDNEFDYDNSFDNKKKKSEENEYQKLKEGLSKRKSKKKIKLPPMLKRTNYSTNNICNEKNYLINKNYRIIRNTYFSPLNSRNKKEKYLKKETFLTILERYENINSNLIKTYQKSLK